MRELISEAQRLYPDKATFSYGQQLRRVDFTQQSAKFEATAQATAELQEQAEPQHQLDVPYDLLVGADGSGSRVRECMQVRVWEGGGGAW